MKYIFDSSLRADTEEYVSFLKAFVPALTCHLKKIGLFDKCYFHISDEPNKNNIDIYEFANKQIKPLFEGRPLMDALSEVDFAERGLMDVAVAETKYYHKDKAHNLSKIILHALHHHKRQSTSHNL